MLSRNDSKLHNITAQDHERISEAIRNAEKKTSGEVYAVVAHQSDDYFFVSGFFAALWSLGIGLFVVLLSLMFSWEISAVSLILSQVATFAVSMAFLKYFPGLRLSLVPRALAYRQASNNAFRQFLSHGIHTTTDRSGVLIFISLAEHYAEVIADAGINEKVDQALWDEMVDILTTNAAKAKVADGFVEVIGTAGKLLSKHFPPIKGQKNELDDRLVEI